MLNQFRDFIEKMNVIHQAHAFDKVATPQIVLFEIIVVLLTIIVLWLYTRYEKKGLQIFGVTAMGLFIQQFFTSPMWNNYKMGKWAYIYQDISWISTLWWTTIIVASTLIVNRIFNKLDERKRFGLYLAAVIPLALIYESVTTGLGISGYSPEVQKVLSGIKLFNAPIEAFYYVPIFMALVISFSRYWTMYIQNKPIIPLKNRPWLRNLIISIAAVFLFELMIEPMVDNVNLPEWTYVYLDVSYLITGGWVVIVWLALNLVDKYLIHFDLLKKFISYLAVVFVVALPIESWLIIKGYRVYGPSTAAAFTGFKVPLIHIPIEVACAIPLYFSLVIAFVKYWEIIIDNRKI